MKIRKSELIEMGACKSGLKRFIAQTNNTNDHVDVLSLIGGKNTTNDLCWLAFKKIGKKSVVEFAVKCAKEVLHLTDAKEAKSAIEAAERWIENPTKDNKDAASAACDDAYAAAAAYDAVAAYDAAAAAYAAAAAAYDAYAAAAYDAYDAVAYDAYDAVAAYDAAAAAGLSKEKINQFLIEMLKYG